ncbi:MAG: M20 family metallopeptidase [Acidobacteriota bacterium]
MPESLMTPFHDWLVQLRRHFHQHPELAYREHETAAKIAEVLAELGVEDVRTAVGGTGVVATLSAKTPGPVVAMRADMDALPLDELNEVDYRSKRPGVMHACGHDGHVTMALGTVRYLIESGWLEKGRGKVLFFFQPAEEGGAGAKAMIDAGALGSEPIGAIFAAHLQPEMPQGEIGFSLAESNAASDTVRFVITGRGGHGSQPNRCIDPIVAGAYLVTQLQTVVSRTVPPLESVVLSIGSFDAGTASNIIPQEAVLRGTLRTFRPELRQEVLKRLEGLARGLELSHGVKVAFTVSGGYPVLVNNERIVRFAMEKGEELLGQGKALLQPPRMGSEDFSYFLQKIPGVFIRLGCHNPMEGFNYGLHSPRFDFDERTLDVGVRLFAKLLTDYIEQSKAS